MADESRVRPRFRHSSNRDQGETPRPRYSFGVSAAFAFFSTIPLSTVGWDKRSKLFGGPAHATATSFEGSSRWRTELDRAGRSNDGLECWSHSTPLLQGFGSLRLSLSDVLALSDILEAVETRLEVVADHLVHVHH